MKDRFEVIREWAKPIEVKTEVTDDFEQVDGKIYYCFIRLYQTAYNSTFSLGRILKKCNELATRPAKNGARYTHAAMNYRLNDNFIGMNFNVNPITDIVIENIRTMDKDDYHDRDSSKFDVYYVKLTKDEYIALKKKLISIKMDSKFKYDYLRLFKLAGEQIYSKLKRLFTSNESEEITNNLEVKNILLVCSTFVTYILSSISKRFDDLFRKSKYSINSYTPNELTYLPGITHMYGGYWKEYASKTREYLKDHPEFEEYMK